MAADDAASRGEVTGASADIDRRLSAAYKRVCEGTQPLHGRTRDLRLVIFSDHHRGVRDGADDFKACEASYNAALGYYFEQGYTLVVLGDVEELWECRPRPALAAYANTIAIESEFHKAGRYYRISGNHDDHWEKPAHVSALLEPRYGPGVKVTEGLILRLTRDNGSDGTVFLTHGHQGDWSSDRDSRLYPLSKWFVRHLWRPVQRLTDWRLTTPADGFELRELHDLSLYAWAREMRRSSLPSFVLIAGHTHTPVFAALDHVTQLTNDLIGLRRELAAAAKGVGMDPLLEEIAGRRAALEYVRVRTAGGQRVQAAVQSDPCYFNTGCCSFSDGDITGIELAKGMIRLVRWPGKDGALQPKSLAERPLDGIF